MPRQIRVERPVGPASSSSRRANSPASTGTFVVCVVFRFPRCTSDQQTCSGPGTHGIALRYS